MTERYCEGERFADLSFTEETFEDCDFSDCMFVDRVREGTVGHQRCPLDFLQTAVLKIQRFHRRMGAV